MFSKLNMEGANIKHVISVVFALTWENLLKQIFAIHARTEFASRADWNLPYYYFNFYLVVHTIILIGFLSTVFLLLVFEITETWRNYTEREQSNLAFTESQCE